MKPDSDPAVFQESAFSLQLHVEDVVLAAAEAALARGEKVVLVLDRGILDGQAFMEREDWLKMIQNFGFTEVTEHSRYTALNTECN